MSYTKQQWADGNINTPYGPISGARLQHIEDGLDAVANGGSISAIDYLVYVSGSTVIANPLTPGLASYSGAATDAAAVIQQAVNQLVSVQNGGTIAFRQALTFTTQLTLYPGISLIGIRPTSTQGSTSGTPTITSSYNGSCILLTGNAGGTQFIALANFELIGNLTKAAQNGIEINESGGNVWDTFIDKVFIDDMGQHGFVIGTGQFKKIHCTQLYVENCVGNGIDGSASNGLDDLELIDPYIAANTGWGMVGLASEQTVGIIGGRFVSNTAGAIQLPSSATSVRIVGTYFQDNGDVSHPQVVIASAGFGRSRNVMTGCIFNSTVVTNHIALAATGAVNISITGCGFYGSVGDAITWVNTAANRILIENCIGYNDVKGVISTPFFLSRLRLGAGTGSGSATPTASTVYQVEGTKVFLSVSGGTGVSITIADPAGTTIASGLTTFVGVLPVQHKINFGAFSVAPTCVASVA